LRDVWNREGGCELEIKEECDEEKIVSFL